MDTPDKRLLALRKEIDVIDASLLELINKRLSLGKEIGEIKKNIGQQVLDKTREVKILERLSALNKGPINDTLLHHIFTDLITASREIQKPQTICYLGPEATFTHIASIHHFGPSVSYVPQANIRDVFREVEKGACNYGVVPVENSIEGAVNHTLDLFFESDLKICAEKYQAISHDLLSNSEKLTTIKTIYSHPQAFAQCREWLKKNLPDADLEECSSTAYAAQKASVTPQSAAIASSEAAGMYHLDVIASKIEDFTRNVTRFLIIGKEKIKSTGNDKTSILFVTAHVPGALFQSLAPVADADINMVKLESRPTKHKNWSYFFIMDVEGHIDDPPIQTVIKKLEECCLHVKWLGSYEKNEI